MNRIAKTNEVEVFVATNMLVATADRIFDKGLTAKNQPIGLSKYGGDYSPGYRKQREKKGLPVGKVILQSGEQVGMKTDWSVISTGNVLGLGFKNSDNTRKSFKLEELYDKDIFKHTKEELKQIDLLIGKKIKQLLNG